MTSAVLKLLWIGASVALSTTLNLNSGQLLADVPEQVIRITAKQFAYSEPEIHLTRGLPVILELTSTDVQHGFTAPDFGVRAGVMPGTVARVRIVPQKAGRFTFHCDHFCGGGHEVMMGIFIVKD